MYHHKGMAYQFSLYWGYGPECFKGLTAENQLTWMLGIGSWTDLLKPEYQKYCTL